MTQILDVTRREVKYRVSLMTALYTQHFLSKVLPQDDHNGIDGYLVRSLYFDSMYNDDLEDKLEGIEERQKIRLRIYSTKDQTAKLELKEKKGDWQQKRSLVITKEDAQKLIDGNYSVLQKMNHPLAQQLFYKMTTEIYRPKVTVQYNRYAFMLDVNDTRITFDQKLVASESNFDLFSENDNFYPVGFSDDVTLEVKYNHFLLSHVRDLLDNIDKSSLSYSKYVMSRFISHTTE